MATGRIPVIVEKSMALAREAGWKVSIRNEKVIITAPDKTALTVGMNPNEQTLKEWRRDASRYGLIDGPARTPDEVEAARKAAEAQGLAEAEVLNAKRKAHAEAEAAKRAEAEEAAKKIAAATANGMTPVAPVTDADGFPVFDPSLLGERDYQKLKLASGKVFCPECWKDGKKFTAKAPQGLAAHRGVRHGMYSAEGAPTNTIPAIHQETSRVHLPDEVQEAVELLRSVIADNLGSDDSAKVADLEAKLTAATAALEEAKAQAARDLLLSDKQYTDAKATFDKAAKADKAKIHDLTQELTGKDGKHAAEVRQLTESFRGLLLKIRATIEGERPIQAVGKIDELLTSFLGE